MFQILPFIEQNSVYMNGGTSNGRSSQKFAHRRLLLARRGRRAPQIMTGGNQNACSDYAASNMTGTNQDARNNIGNGIVQYGRSITMLQITDGTSNTMMVSERRLARSVLGSGSAPDDNEGYIIGWDIDTVGNTNNQPVADSNTNAPDGSGNLTTDWNASPTGAGSTFGSADPSGFNVLFGDGTVRSCSYSISLAVFQNLGNINDGNSIDLTSVAP